MNGAELDTKRRSLGLSIEETAEVFGVNRRSIEYWIASPDPVGRKPEEIDARMIEVEVSMGDLCDWLVERGHDAGDKVVTLQRYRSQAALDASDQARGLPIGAHAIAVSWAADDLRTDGHEVRMEWVGDR